ncbi:MAG TPA: leucyl/phenylalanyl-tRNA--protein transferase [Pseudolabrys sp.]
MAFETQRLSLPIAASTRAARRSALFRESLFDMAQRWTLGLAWVLSRKHIRGLPSLLRLWFDELLAPDYALPDPERALENLPGLAGIVHDLTLPTLLAAYRRGLYPWAHIAPLKWWSPPQRSVLFFKNFHISKNMRKELRRGRYTVTFDRDFEGVIAACAGRREGRWHLTWFTPRIMRTYAEAFDAGHAHSFEVWNEARELAGGYGLTIGSAYFGESLFSREPNTSKLGQTALAWHLAKWGYKFNDGKLFGQTWRDMGYREIPRREFLGHLTMAVRAPGKSGRWQVQADLATYRIGSRRPATDA